MKPYPYLLAALLAVPVWLQGQDDANEPQAVDSKITEVTVYADRAQVTRTATVPVGNAQSQFSFTGLPGWIDDASVRVQLTPAQNGRILEVQVLRDYLAKASAVEVQEAQAAVQEIADQLAVIEDQRAALETKAQHMESIRVFSLEKLPKDTALRPVPVEEYDSVLTFVHESMLSIAEERRELDRRERDLRPELDARNRKLSELQGLARLEEASVLVTVQGNANANGSLKLTYLTPGATWEPVHDLRTIEGGKEVELESYAIVTQTTGEHWENAQITLSTQSASQMTRIPELESLLVGGDAGMPDLIPNQSGESFEMAQNRYAVQNQGFYDQIGHGGKRLFSNDVSGNITVQAQVQTRSREVFQTLQERGTSAQFKSLNIQTIRAEGKPVRVPIGSMKLAADQRIIAAPEASLNAARTVRLKNTGDQPLLPGRVSLFLDGAFLGATEAPFVAQQEPFSLYLGVVDQVKLSRRLDREKSELTRWGTGTRMQVVFVVEVENLSDQEVTVELGERIPVSNSADVRIKGVRITPEVPHDEDGLVRWNVKLAGKEIQEFRVEYAIEYPSDMTTKPANGQSPQLLEKLRSLESNF